MSFQIIQRVEVNKTVNPGDSVWIAYRTDMGNVLYFIERVPHKVDVTDIFLYESDGHMGVSYDASKYYGLLH